MVGAGSSGSTGTPAEEERDRLTPPPPPVRHRRVSGRIVILLVVILLVIGAAGGWYYERHHSKSGHAAPTPVQLQGDVALAAHVGVQASDLPGWKTTPGSSNSALVSVAVPSAAATAAQRTATATLAQCLKVPTAEVTRAFGGPSPARTAVATTPVYGDPGGAGLSVSSAVAVMRGPTSEHADFNVFSAAAAFATCYKPYAQAMLPYAAGSAAATFTSVTVQPATVTGVPTSRLHVQAFDVARTAGKATVVTAVVVIFGGRAQAIVAMASPSGFPATTGSSLISAVEGRVAASLPKKK